MSPYRWALIGLLSLFMVSEGMAQKQRWTWVNPFPLGNRLRDVATIGKNSLVAVGDAATIIKSRDRGQSWKRLRIPIFEDLYSLSFADSLTGYAVGTGGTILRTKDCGDSWETLLSGRQDTLRKIWALSTTLILAVGDTGTILRSIDGGDNWTYDPLPGFQSNFNSLFFGDNGLGYIVGDSFGIASPNVWVSSDSGSSWLPFGQPAPSLTGKSLNSIWVPKADPNKAVIVGEKGLIINTQTAGLSWNAPLTGTTVPLKGVWFFNDQIGFAVGPNRTLLRTTDCGDSWSVVPLQNGDELITITGRDSLEGYIMGSAGVILQTLDGGNNWASISSGFYPALTDVTFLDDSFGIAAGQFGVVARTSNGGDSWQTTFAGAFEPIEALSKAGDNPQSTKYWAAGGTFGDSARIFCSDDLGASWQKQFVPSPLKLFGIVFTDSLHGTAVGLNGTIFRTVNGGLSWLPSPSGSLNWLLDVSQPSVQTAYVVGGFGTILKTTDGGQNWNSQTSNTQEWLTTVSFLDDSFGMAAGNHGAILRTFDGGQNWDDVSPPGVDRDFTGISLSRDNRHSNRSDKKDFQATVVGYGGLIYYSDDSGENWTRQFSRTHQNLLDCHFTDNQSGFAVGADGTIIRMDSILKEDPLSVSEPLFSPLELAPLYPNPGRDQLHISFTLSRSQYLEISLLRMDGQLVSRMEAGHFRPGKHQLTTRTHHLAQGMYLVYIQGDGIQDTRRWIKL